MLVKVRLSVNFTFKVKGLHSGLYMTYQATPTSDSSALNQSCKTMNACAVFPFTYQIILLGDKGNEREAYCSAALRPGVEPAST